MRRKNLWWHVNEWSRLGERRVGSIHLASGPVLVLDPELANGVLTCPDHYTRESPFFRTERHAPLEEEICRSLTTQLVRLASRRRADARSVVRSAWGQSGTVRTQEWGVLLMREVFGPVFTGAGESSVDAAIDSFVRQRTLHHDIQGRIFSKSKSKRATMREQLGRRIVQIGPGRDDMIGAVANVETALTERERGELFLRLVQSAVAFAGVTLEAALVLAERYKGTAGTVDRPHVMETLRMFPTSWRLVRVASKRHIIGNEFVTPGQQVIVASAIIHRNRDQYDAPDSFQPSRFTERTSERQQAYMPFGRGRGMCPGRESGVAAIIEVAQAIHDQYEIKWTRVPAGRPYVRSLMVMERGTFSYRLRSARDE